jgi:hypothetical protein
MRASITASSPLPPISPPDLHREWRRHTPVPPPSLKGRKEKWKEKRKEEKKEKEREGMNKRKKERTNERKREGRKKERRKE